MSPCSVEAEAAEAAVIHLDTPQRYDVPPSVRKLTPSGRRFAGDFGALDAPIPYVLAAAQAAEAVLDAIAPSGGTRPSVLVALIQTPAGGRPRLPDQPGDRREVSATMISTRLPSPVRSAFSTRSPPPPRTPAMKTACMPERATLPGASHIALRRRVEPVRADD
jgi:hypothetical protein